MRILMVITRGDSVGGAQLHALDLARRLRRDRHDVLVVMGTSGPLMAMLAEVGVRAVVCDSLRRQLAPIHEVAAVRGLGRIIRAFEPDLVTTHSSKAGMIGRMASRFAGVPCIFTAHGWSFADGIPQPSRTIWRGAEMLAAPLAARIICVSQADYDLGLRAGIAPKRLVMIHNGLRDEVPPARIERNGSAPVRIVMVARFAPQKDHPTLLHAIRSIPGCELDLIGDGPRLPAMRELASSLGIRNRVRFHGYRADVSCSLAEADLFVLASNYEGFPLTTLEAMRAGLPTIVSDAGGAAEAVAHGVTGYVVPPRDIGVLQGQLEAMVKDRDLRRSMGEAARARFLDEFTFERMYETTYGVYEQVAQSRHAPGAPRRSALPVPRPSCSGAALAVRGRDLEPPMVFPSMSGADVKASGRERSAEWD